MSTREYPVLGSCSLSLNRSFPRPSQVVETEAAKTSSLVPIRVEFETDTHRIRDCFVWNLRETVIKPESFARTFCMDLDLSLTWVETISNQIKAQLEEYEGIASMDLGLDGVTDTGMEEDAQSEEIPECRVIVSVSGIFSHRVCADWKAYPFFPD